MSIKMKDQITLPAFNFFIKLLCFSILLGGSFSCWATWTGMPGYRDSTGQQVCDFSASTPLPSTITTNFQCEVDIPLGNGSPDSTGNHQMRINLILNDTPGVRMGSAWDSAFRTLDPAKQLGEQNIYWGGTGSGTSFKSASKYLCYLLEDYSVHKYYAFNSMPQSCFVDIIPVPPGPNYLACTFNSGNALDVALGEIDRSAIGTTSGTTTKTEKSLDVTCTGEGTATYSVQFEYTPITAGSDELITATANGLGVAMSFNDAPVKTTDKITRTYSTGTQTERLAFEPVRNPAVQASDIPTGAFTASAVMVLTEE